MATGPRRPPPRARHRRRRPSLVDEMKTSQSGMSQCCRCAATSGRACSAACAVSIDADPMPAEEPLDRYSARRRPGRATRRADLFPRQVRLVGLYPEDLLAALLDPSPAAITTRYPRARVIVQTARRRRWLTPKPPPPRPRRYCRCAPKAPIMWPVVPWTASNWPVATTGVRSASAS